MSRNWHQPFLTPAREEIDSLVLATVETLPHISYQRSTEEVRSDLLETWRRYTYLYFDTLTTLVLPTGPDVTEFEKVARRRLHQSVELVDLHAAFRAGARILLENALTLVDPMDAGMVGSLTLEFEDLMATAAERAYLEEQRSFVATENDYTVQLLLRMLHGEVMPNDAQVSMAPIQGYDFSRTFAVVSFARSGSAAFRWPVGEGVLPQLSTTLRSVLPFGLQLPYDDTTLFLLVPGDAVNSLRKLLERVLSTSFNTNVRAGISSPSAGLGGVMPSADAATRARVVGEILEPAQLVHSWDQIRAFDVFRDEGIVSDYVSEQLGPLLEIDARKGTQLVQTLAAFLEANGNRKSAARILTVHINTLDYRLRQIRTILGKDSLTDGSFTAHLAVRLFPLYLLNKQRETEASRGAPVSTSAG